MVGVMLLILLHPNRLMKFYAGTLDIRVRGNTLIPPSILSRFSILCAILRQLHLLLSISLLTNELSSLSPDAFFVDQLSAGLPLLHALFPGIPILFYCHFPDLLLARGRGMWWKRWYRLPFDKWEEWSMGFADRIAVNSGFTRGVVRGVWPRLGVEKELDVVYPCVDIKSALKDQKDRGEKEKWGWKDKEFMLSINRFEEKKDVGLAIKAFAGLGFDGRKGVRLVVAGGYDSRVPENVSYHSQLQALCDRLKLRHTTARNAVTALAIPSDIDVLFLLSVPDALKAELLRSAKLLVYTPANEHFGIVPLEAMLSRTPVLAANSGGPLETIVDDVTGWLRSPKEVKAWSQVMDRVLHEMSRAKLEAMGQQGRDRVIKEFSDVKMAQRLHGILQDMAVGRKKPVERNLGPIVGLVLLNIMPVLALSVGLLAYLVHGWYYSG
jgi:alpha-1,3/alpha-1,6-mannosyltransferase